MREGPCHHAGGQDWGGCQEVWGVGHYYPPGLVDMEGVVQVVKVTGRNGLGVGGVGEVLDLIRDAFAEEVESE